MLTKDERMLLEAIKGMLGSGDRLGLDVHADEQEKSNKLERGLEHLHDQIDEMFEAKAAKFTHCTSITAAFTKVHCYKYVDDVTFKEAMKKELTAQGVPSTEAEEALDAVDDVIEELSKEKKGWSEGSHGFHPDLDDVMSIPGDESDED